MIGKLFSFLPIGSLIYRLNLFSGLNTSLTTVVIYFIILHLINRSSDQKNRITAIVSAFSASLAFAFTYLAWSNSTMIETFPTLSLIIALLILTIFLWTKNQNIKYLYLLSFMFGIGVSYHSTIILLIPIFLIFALEINHKEILKTRNITLILFFGLLGLFPYLYLPIRALSHPLRNWGDPHTFKNFLNFVTGKEYQGRLFFFPQPLTGNQFTLYIKSLLGEFTPFILAFILPGIVWLKRNNKNILLFLFLILIVNISFIINIFQITEMSPYPSGSIVFAILIGLGLVFMLELSTSKNHKWLNLLLILITISLPLFPLTTNYSRANNNKDFFAYDYARNLLQSLDKNAILIFDGDNIFPLEYLQHIEKIRPDIILVEKKALRKEWYLKQLKSVYNKQILKFKIPKKYSTIDLAFEKLVDENIEKHPIYTSNLENAILKKYALLYNGYTFKVDKNKKGILIKRTTFPYKYRNNPSELSSSKYFQKTVNPDYLLISGIRQPEINLIYAYMAVGEIDKALKIATDLQEFHSDVALFSFILGSIYENNPPVSPLGKGGIKGEKNNLDISLRWYKKTIAQDSAFSDGYYGLGRIYAKKNNHSKALENFEKASIYMPNNPEIRYYLAKIYEMRGLINKSIQNWEIILKIDANPLLKKEAKKQIEKLKL
jgi:tetratricopeptide (TPR) repeat protein